MSNQIQKHSESTSGDRALALQKVLADKNLIPEGYIENFTNLMENEWDPANGAKIVAHAWVPPEYRTAKWIKKFATENGVCDRNIFCMGSTLATKRLLAADEIFQGRPCIVTAVA
jgi:Nitrile hydratase, alpha chain